MTNFSYKISVCCFSPAGLANKERERGGGGQKETCAERQTNCLSKLPKEKSQMFSSPSKQTTSFLLFEAWIPVIHTDTHTHTPLPFSLSHTTCISPLSYPSFFSFVFFPPLLPLLLSCSCFLFLFFSFFFPIMNSPLSTCDSLLKNPKQNRKKKKKRKTERKVKRLCPLSASLWLCVPLGRWSSIPSGGSHNLRRSPSSSEFVPCCDSRRPSSRFKEKKKNWEANYSFPLFEFFASESCSEDKPLKE